MARYRLLHIWDAADGAFENGGVPEAGYKLPVTSIKELSDGLDNLVARGHTFRAILISAHGAPGMIKIPRGATAMEAWSYAIYPLNVAVNYSNLFDGFGTIVFDGCNVAEGEEGKQFLVNIGGRLLQKFGGTVTGCTKRMIVNSGVLYYLTLGGHFAGTIAGAPHITASSRGRAYPWQTFTDSYRTAVFGHGGHLLDTLAY